MTDPRHAEKTAERKGTFSNQESCDEV